MEGQLESVEEQRVEGGAAFCRLVWCNWTGIGRLFVFFCDGCFGWYRGCILVVGWKDEREGSMC